jgi:hypothetical protein
MCKLKDYFESKKAEAEKLYQLELDRIANVDIDKLKIPKDLVGQINGVDSDEYYENERDNNL